MYNLHDIMVHAWKLFRKLSVSFAEALHRAWLSAKAAPINAKRIEDAKTAAGILERVLTWTGWKSEGREVRHGEQCLFQVSLIFGSRGDGASYLASLFGESQTDPITAE